MQFLKSSNYSIQINRYQSGGLGLWIIDHERDEKIELSVDMDSNKELLTPNEIMLADKKSHYLYLESLIENKIITKPYRFILGNSNLYPITKIRNTHSSLSNLKSEKEMHPKRF